MSTTTERARAIADNLFPDRIGYPLDPIGGTYDGECYCREHARDAVFAIALDCIADNPDASDSAIAETVCESVGAIFRDDDGEVFPYCGETIVNAGGYDRCGTFCGLCGESVDYGTPMGTYVGAGVECYNCRATGVFVDSYGYASTADGWDGYRAEIRHGSDYYTAPIIGDRGMVTFYPVVVTTDACPVPTMVIVAVDVMETWSRWELIHETLLDAYWELDADAIQWEQVPWKVDQRDHVSIRFADRRRY